MKRLISLILFLTMVVLLNGCAGTTGQRPSEQDSLTNEVGNATFVGDHSRSGPGVQYQRSLALDMLATQP
jgi:Flp pilus assembly protein TadD